jgi:aminoglycoside phosphotransferase (APT) family kinase protein
MTQTSILETLLARAGVCRDVRRIDTVTGGLTNRTAIVHLWDGSRYVVREYGWPYDCQDDLERPVKERFLHSLLLDQGVPVPRILAEAREHGRAAVLMEYLPGELLGDLADALAERDRRAAWRAAGEALRRAHEVRYPPGSHGWVVGDRLRPFAEGSWGEFHRHRVLENAQQLVTRKPGVALDVQALQSVLERVVPLVNQAPSTLLHNDAHPWNVLVHSTPNGWECTGWLDWEYAWVGDPAWDLVRMDLFRMKPIGPTPPAFYEGYGSAPPELYRAFYELHIHLWMANQYLDGDRSLLPTYAAAMEYVDALESRLATPRRLVDAWALGKGVTGSNGWRFHAQEELPPSFLKEGA